MSEILQEMRHNPILAGVVYVAVVIAFLCIAAYVILALYGVQKRMREVGEDVGLVKHQVQNDHKTNLRDDTDKQTELLTAIQTDVKAIHVTLGVLDFRLGQVEQHRRRPRRGYNR